ncbi:molybdate ABC transporter substrate-binding protein [Aphanothece hegewaldii CCALA 016]|uniref:Molybdate ABC transporter substrate-binding protein n=1 Tax=Aphanothece hegewaldii CCALA 016 TaxID=2107694 RepID=A0A2T1LZS2_9CHRO|nr:molybdate ABC transporter substrate-binding protein [Aphanothece hegewaldii]PSF37921.1 molybdate ABC transporter substrate-binding protein [Aphanothece hegewaldii CCALA 016]
MFNYRLIRFLCFFLLPFCLIISSYLLTPSIIYSAPNEILVSAAASLKDALEEIKPIYTKEKGKISLIYNFGSSGSLQQQIEQGAPVDVFISAAKKQMDALQDKKLLLDGTRKNLLKNQMVLIVPKSNTTIKSFQDLATDKTKKIAMGEPKSVPAGQYAQEVLTSLGLLNKVTNKVIYAKDVRQVLSYVATGNVDAGFVYLTDAKTSDDVKIVATASEKSHSQIIYPVAVIKDSKNINDAKDYVEFLSSNRAKNIFRKYGFTPI